MQNYFHSSNSLLLFQKYFIYKVSSLDRNHVSNNLLFYVVVIQILQLFSYLGHTVKLTFLLNSPLLVISKIKKKKK